MPDLSALSSSYFLLGPKNFPLIPFLRKCFDSCFQCTWGSLPVYSGGFHGVYTVNTENPERPACALQERPLVLANRVSPLTLLPVGICPVGSCLCGNLWQVGSETFTSSNKERVGEFHFRSDGVGRSCLLLPAVKGEPVGGLLRPPGAGSWDFVHHLWGKVQAWIFCLGRLQGVLPETLCAQLSQIEIGISSWNISLNTQYFKSISTMLNLKKNKKQKTLFYFTLT